MISELNGPMRIYLAEYAVAGDHGLRTVDAGVAAAVDQQTLAQRRNLDADHFADQALLDDLGHGRGEAAQRGVFTLERRLAHGDELLVAQLVAQRVDFQSAASSRVAKLSCIQRQAAEGELTASCSG